MDKVIFPALDNLVAEKKITDQKMKKISDLVNSMGIEVIEPKVRILDDITLNTVEPDGYVLETILSITDTVTIRNAVKKFSKKENFAAAIKNQRRVYNAIKGTKFEGKVPKPEFWNRSTRIMVTPYEDGMTVAESLEGKTASQKETILKGVTDDYVTFFGHLNKPEVKKKLKFPDSLQSFQHYIQNLYMDNYCGVLNVSFGEIFGSDLEKAKKWVIHGDFHPRNTILNGKNVHLDWPKAARNGFPEFDIGSLLRKSDISLELEEKLARYAAFKMFKNEGDMKASLSRYMKNQIKSDLVSARRYFLASLDEKSPELSTKLKNMATVWYNTGIRRTKRAIKLGILDKDFRKAETFLQRLLKRPPIAQNLFYGNLYTIDEDLDRVPDDKKVPVVSDDAYAHLKKFFNPNVNMTQENSLSSVPLTGMVVIDPEKSLKNIKKRNQFSKYKRWTKLAAACLLGISLVIGFGYSISKTVKASNEKKAEMLENSYYRVRNMYQSLFENGFERVMTSLIDGKLTTRMHQNSSIIDKVAVEYNLRPKLIRTMLKVNRYYGGIQSSLNSEFIRVEDVNILDPFIAADYSNPVVDPIENLELGAKRLSNLINKHGNEKDALIEFYAPMIGDKSKSWPYGSGWDKKQFVYVREDVKKLAYTAMTEMAYSTDGGMQNIYLKIPPKDF